MDEHEALIEYSEMTSFDFNSKEFLEVKRDYMECKDIASNILHFVVNAIQNLKIVKNF